MEKEITVIEPIQKELTVFSAKTKNNAEQAKAIVIKSEITLNKAVNAIKGLKELKKSVEDTFDPILDKALESKRAAEATRKEIVTQKEKHINPIVAAITAYSSKIDIWDKHCQVLEQKKIDDDAEKEKIKRDAELLKAQDKLTVFESSITDKEELKMKLEKELTLADITDEYAEVVRAKIEILETGITDDAEAATALADAVDLKVNEPAPQLVAAPVQTTKVEGTQRRVTYKTTIVNPIALVKAVAEGRAPLNIIKWEIGKLNSSRKLGVKYPGCNYIEDIKRV